MSPGSPDRDPPYNQGNDAACYRIHEGAISEIDRKFSRRPTACQVLQTGVDRADQAPIHAADTPRRPQALGD
jgi:hypothetical protein